MTEVRSHNTPGPKPARKQAARRGGPKAQGASRSHRKGAFDTAVSRLLQQRPQDFISFGLDQRPVQVEQPISEKLPALGRNIDGGYVVVSSGDRFAVHLELHRRHQSALGLLHDVLEAQVRIFRREALPVLSLVFDLYGDEDQQVLQDVEEVYGVGLAQGRGSRCAYRRVNLRGKDWRELLALPVSALWALVPLAKGGRSKEALVAARDAIEGQQGVEAGVKLDQLAVLSFVAEAEGFAPADLMEYLYGEDKLMQSEIYRSLIQKGKVKGREEGFLESLLSVYASRFGDVPEAVRRNLLRIGDQQRLLALMPTFVTASARVIATQVARSAQDKDTPAQ